MVGPRVSDNGMPARPPRAVKIDARVKSASSAQASMSKSDRDKKCQRAEIGLIAEIARPQSGGPLPLPIGRAARVMQPPQCVQHLSIEPTPRQARVCNHARAPATAIVAAMMSTADAPSPP